jgi:hypothetical protein
MDFFLYFAILCSFNGSLNLNCQSIWFADYVSSLCQIVQRVRFALAMGVATSMHRISETHTHTHTCKGAVRPTSNAMNLAMFDCSALLKILHAANNINKIARCIRSWGYHVRFVFPIMLVWAMGVQIPSHGPSHAGHIEPVAIVMTCRRPSPQTSHGTHWRHPATNLPSNTIYKVNYQSQHSTEAHTQWPGWGPTT